MRRAALAAALALAGAAGCGGGEDAGRPPPPPQRAEVPTAPAPDVPRQLARARGEPRLETLVEGLEAPWDLAFLPDGRALVTERPGRVRLIERDGALREEPLADGLTTGLGEGGLLGIAVDPRFSRNRRVYLYRTKGEENQVVRMRLAGTELREERVVAGGIAAAAIHDGGRLRFGPDERLYVSTGDADRPDLAQDPGSLNGKILRLEPEQYRGGGGRPEVVTSGHRNPQGFDWQPRSGRLYASEHGPDGDDEVNLLEPGSNYGWPHVRGRDRQDGFVAPIAVYPESIAPSGATFVRLPGSEWTGDYLIGCLVGEQIRRLRFEGSRVVVDEPLLQGELGRVRTVVEGPDGALYALTSNRDGRGAPGAGDDRVVRIVPPAG